MKKLIVLFIFDLFLFLILISLNFLFAPHLIILPHHNLVQSTRQQFLRSISLKRPLTNIIILIGPDHFSQNQRQILTSNQDWHLSTGNVHFHDIGLSLPVNNVTVKADHAIYNPLTDLKTFFPKASVYPILIGQKVPAISLSALISQINSRCHLDCLVVFSVDFSHYLPATLADVHDQFTLNNLSSLNLAGISSAEVDSPQSLYIAASLAKLNHLNRFDLFAHTNSGFIVHNPDIETTTHLFGYYAFGLANFPKITTSVQTPFIINRQLNQTTLGDRFFYGTDNISQSTLPNFVIGTIKTNNSTTQYFLPITKANSQVNFVNGVDKQNLIKSYFDAIPNSPSLTKDYFWGKLVYENRD